MHSPEDKRLALEDQRRNPRRQSQARIHVSLETGSFGGQAENISTAGVFFFSQDRIRVHVEVIENGVVKTYPGRIVRMEPISETHTGFAIEFERT